MTIPLGPYALSTAANAPSFNVEWDQVASPPIGIDLENVSGSLLLVTIAGKTYWLTPWTARYFTVPSNSIEVVVQPRADISPATSDPLKLVATLYQIGDSPPVQQERSLAGLALVAAITGNVGLTPGNSVGVTGTVTTVNESVPLATLALGPGTAANVNIPSWVNSIELWSDDPTNNIVVGSLTVIGNTSNLTYINTSFNDTQGIFKNPLRFDIDGGLDNSIHIVWGGADAGKHLYVLGSAAPSGVNNIATPMLVAETDSHPRIAHQTYAATAATANSAHVLLAPSAGYCWEISAWSVYPSATPTVSQLIFLRDVLTTFSFAGVWVATGSSAGISAGGKLHIAGPVDVVNNGIGVSCQGTVVAKQVPLA